MWDAGAAYYLKAGRRSAGDLAAAKKSLLCPGGVGRRSSERISRLNDIGTAAGQCPRREQDEALRLEPAQQEIASRGKIFGDGGAGRRAQPGERDVGSEFARLGRNADAPHEPFLFGLKFDQGGSWLGPGDEGPGLGAAEGTQLLDRHGERRPPALFGGRMDLPRGRIVDVADEAQGQMVMFGFDPERAGNAAAQHGKIHREIGRDFEAREQTGHGSLLSMPRSRKSSRQTGKDIT